MNTYLKLALGICLIQFLIPSEVLLCQEDIISKDQLIEDVRQMAKILEDSHPDPYVNGGGKIVFHQRLQNTIISIPEEGMTKSDFFRLLAPFVAGVSDAHTSLFNRYPYRPNSPGGIPLSFDVVERSLYIDAVQDKKDIDLIGSLLLSVEDIPLVELVARMKRLRGCDNDYTALANLAASYLWRKEALADLIPEWETPGQVKVTLRLPSNKIVNKSLKIPDEVKFPLLKPETSIVLPSTEKCEFAYDFLDDDKDIALLKITSMMGYREDFELSGTSETMDGLTRAWKRYYGTEPPDNDSLAIAGIPSAAETFNSLMSEMRSSGSNNLILDVRDNQGGNSLICDFLWYFLFGREKYLWVKGETATDITKLSPLYFESRPNTSLNDIRKDVNFEINENDYDFRYNCFHNPEKLASLDIEGIMEQYLSMMPSFYRYYNADENEIIYTPDNIYVLCSAGTFSAGYEIMWGLYKLGAKIVGTTSSMAGNFFTDILYFKLNNSGLQGQISSKSQTFFPDDPVRGKELKPDIELKYDYLKKCNFDRNAAVLLALEEIMK